MIFLKKILPLFLFIIISILLPHIANANGWIKTHTNNSNVFFIDPDSVKLSGSSVSFWWRSDSTKLDGSTYALISIDCETHIKSNIKAIMYLPGGTILHSTKKSEAEIEPLSPLSYCLGSALLSYFDKAQWVKANVEARGDRLLTEYFLTPYKSNGYLYLWYKGQFDDGETYYSLVKYGNETQEFSAPIGMVIDANTSNNYSDIIVVFSNQSLALDKSLNIHKVIIAADQSLNAQNN